MALKFQQLAFYDSNLKDDIWTADKNGHESVMSAIQTFLGRYKTILWKEISLFLEDRLLRKSNPRKTPHRLKLTPLKKEKENLVGGDTHPSQLLPSSHNRRKSHVYRELSIDLVRKVRWNIFVINSLEISSFEIGARILAINYLLGHVVPAHLLRSSVSWFLWMVKLGTHLNSPTPTPGSSALALWPRVVILYQVTYSGDN